MSKEYLLIIISIGEHLNNTKCSVTVYVEETQKGGLPEEKEDDSGNDERNEVDEVNGINRKKGRCQFQKSCI